MDMLVFYALIFLGVLFVGIGALIGMMAYYSREGMFDNSHELEISSLSMLLGVVILFAVFSV